MKVRSLLIVAAVCVATITVTPTSASALPSCNGDRLVTIAGYIDVFVPSYGSNLDCVLGIGNTNSGVTWLQISLRDCYNQHITIDGIFGPATRTALINAQTWEKYVFGENIVVDGVYGPQTRRAMRWSGLWNYPTYSIVECSDFGGPL